MIIVFAYSAPKHKEYLDKLDANDRLISYFAIANKTPEQFKQSLAKKEVSDEQRIIKRRVIKGD